MPRQPRLVLPDVAVHVVQRGNNRHQCFFREGDYAVYLLHLQELARKYDCAVHAYCLMTNHVHLLMTPATSDGVSELMRNLGPRYVQYVNRTYGRTGTLWQGRYRSCIAQSARYVLACYRYIELNPVRAGMVHEPGHYGWSSYRANAGGEISQLITPHPEFLALGPENASRRRAYSRLFDEALDPPTLRAIREATRGDFPLCSPSFVCGIQLPPGRKIKRGQAGRPANPQENGDDEDLEIGI
jgi:putative transposase